MISGLAAYNAGFLADLSDTEARIAQTNKQISSGVRVSVASDDPAAISPILDYQEQLDSIAQTQSNLSGAKTEASVADGALQTASNLLDQLISLGSNGASNTSTAQARVNLGLHVQKITEQLVSLANTSIGSHFIFGGDQTTTAPYTYDWSATGSAVSNSAQTNTATIRDSDGNSIVPRMTAQQIFDARASDGTPAASNILQGAYLLGQALLTNNQSAASSALDNVKAGVAQLEQATTFYGNAENWLDQAAGQATAKTNNMTEALAALRDADIPAAATQLSLDKVALEAALSAHGNLQIRSLFDYLG